MGMPVLTMKQRCRKDQKRIERKDILQVSKVSMGDGLKNRVAAGSEILRDPPEISVIMGIHNERYPGAVRHAVDSILSQE